MSESLGTDLPNQGPMSQYLHKYANCLSMMQSASAGKTMRGFNVFTVSVSLKTWQCKQVIPCFDKL